MESDGCVGVVLGTAVRGVAWLDADLKDEERPRVPSDETAIEIVGLVVSHCQQKDSCWQHW